MAGLNDSLSATKPTTAQAWLVRLFPVLLFLLALGPRLVAIGRYVTPDELVWVYRSLQFREALLDGRWAGTLVAGHPGVTTTWLGAISLSLQVWLSPDARAAYDWLTHVAALTPDNVEAFRRLAVLLTGGRVAVAVVNSLGVVGMYLLVRRLGARFQGPGSREEERDAEKRGEARREAEDKISTSSSAPLLSALHVPPRSSSPGPWPLAPGPFLIGLLLALDPFLAGHSGLFHVDGLSATFATLALLALACSCGTGFLSCAPRKHRIRILCYSGVLTGLAILTKTPTLVLLPVTGLALLWAVLRERRDLTGLGRPVRSVAATYLARGLLWAAGAVLTIVLLYPALWSDAAAVLATVGGSANRHLDEALLDGRWAGTLVAGHPGVTTTWLLSLIHI